MASKTGHLSISDLLAARFQSVAEFGESTVAEVLQADLDAHNAIMEDMISGLCEVTDERLRTSGSSVGGDMKEVDEHGEAPTQKDTPGSTVAFPLRLFQYNVGWTRKWLQSATPADLATASLAAQKAHHRVVVRQIKRAIYTATNYTFTDHLIDNVSLGVKAFVNADSDPIPDGPFGEAFDGATHTHYDGEASLTAAFLTALIDDVTEHGHTGDVKVAINSADEAAVRALSGFTAYVDPRLTLAADSNEAMKRVDYRATNNRAIGIFGSAEIWVKPWAIPSYLFAWDAAAPKPLAFRQRTGSVPTGLQMVAEFESHPLQIEFFEAEFGVGVWQRTNGAVLYTANATYASPTIT